MMELPSLETSVVSSSSAATTQGQPNTPGFLRIPRELRDRIYSYFVAVDQHFDYVYDYMKQDGYEGITCKDLAITRVNQRIRAEAWDCLVKLNLWVSVTHSDVDHENKLFRKQNTYSWLCQPWVPYEQFPEDVSRRLDNEIALRFWRSSFLESPRDAQPSKTYMFAYHPLAYGYFVSNLSDHLESHPPTCSVQLLPSASLSGSRFSKLLEPLGIFRDLGDVYSPDSESNATLLTLTPHNIREFYHANELITIKQCFQHQGQSAELSGRFSDAMCHYWIGKLLAECHPYEDEGCPEWNSLMYMGTDMAIGFSRCAHKHFTGLRKYTPYENIIDLNRPSILFRSLHVVNVVFERPSLTDSQRRAAHLYRSLLLFHYGQLIDRLSHRVWPSMEEFHAIDALYFDDIRSSSCGFQFRGEIFYFLAAKDLFYAHQVALSPDLLATLDGDERAICRMIQERPGPQTFPVVEHSVPLLGTWRGDPRLWRDLSHTERVLVKLFRQRCNELSDGDTMDYDELERQYTALGITWQHGGYGDLLLDP
ncbi:hypothetical protein PG991_013875 [Apiospora marii]|uniref:Uncharacterized protein n=1 Tax=Apiospora marii TaxID=335849 RepID=A0ABR1R7K7_9PEZI